MTSERRVELLPDGSIGFVPAAIPDPEHTPRCDTFWGSHGCDLDRGHDGVHHCGGDDWDAEWDSEEFPCSEYDETNSRVRYCLIDVRAWSEWMDHG